jgi:hypothetical protein
LARFVVDDTSAALCASLIFLAAAGFWSEAEQEKLNSFFQALAGNAEG